MKESKSYYAVIGTGRTGGHWWLPKYVSDSINEALKIARHSPSVACVPEGCGQELCKIEITPIEKVNVENCECCEYCCGYRISVNEKFLSHCPDHEKKFRRYYNDKTIFEPYLKIAFANEAAAFYYGVRKDWSNVEIIHTQMPVRAFEGFEIMN